VASNGRHERQVDSRLFGVDYDLVWDVVMDKFPVLRQQIDEFLRQERVC
jgi:uncharacterized protein with HEPN domain